jgi:outer membrane receptor for ferric coprogen and ferric-rhodotorulic acid
MQQDFSLKPISIAVALAFTSLTTALVSGTAVSAELSERVSNKVSQNQYNFSISAGSLSTTLNSLAQQSGFNIAFSPALVQGKSSAKIVGKFTLEHALKIALKTTQLVAKKQAKGGYVVVAQPNDVVNTLAITQVINAKTEQDNTSYTTASMTSATGLNLSLRETPQSVTVMTRQVIDDFALVSVDAVLANTPGININRAETDRVFPTARGFGIDYLQVDGVSSEANGMMNSDFLSDTATYERVEIIRGAAGILAGAGNPSATINLIRKRPTADFNANITASAGSWNAGRLSGDISGSLNENGSIRGRAVAAYNSSDSYIDFYSNDRTVLYGIAEFDLSDHTTATVGIDYQTEDINGTTYGEPVPFFYDDGTPTDFDISVSTGAPWTFKDKERTTFFADIRHEFSNGWQVKAAVSQLEETMDSYLVYLYGYINKETGAGLTASTNDLASDRDLSSFSLSANGNFSLFGREHELLIGWNQTTEETSRLNHDIPNVAIDNFFEWPLPFTGNSDVISGIWGWQNKQSGGYISSRWSVAEPLTLLLGTRLSNWDSEE